VLDGETGLLVPPRDPNRLAKAITNLLQHPEEAKRMGNRGRERVRTGFSQEKMLDETMALYRYYGFSRSTA